MEPNSGDSGVPALNSNLTHEIKCPPECNISVKYPVVTPLRFRGRLQHPQPALRPLSSPSVILLISSPKTGFIALLYQN